MVSAPARPRPAARIPLWLAVAVEIGLLVVMLGLCAVGVYCALDGASNSALLIFYFAGIIYALGCDIVTPSKTWGRTVSGRRRQAGRTLRGRSNPR